MVADKCFLSGIPNPAGVIRDAVFDCFSPSECVYSLSITIFVPVSNVIYVERVSDWLQCERHIDYTEY